MAFCAGLVKLPFVASQPGRHFTLQVFSQGPAQFLEVDTVLIVHIVDASSLSRAGEIRNEPAFFFR